MKSFVQSYPLIFDNIIFNFILFHVPTNPPPPSTASSGLTLKNSKENYKSPVDCN